MSDIYRADEISISRIAKKLDKSGFLKIDGHAAKVGVLIYHNDDGTVTREMVTPEVLFSDESISTLTGAPITIRHNDELLDMSNAKEVTVGAVLSAKQDGDKMAVSMVIHDAAAINDIIAGNLELSCGYRTTVKEDAGVIDGHQFDCVQVRRVHNHLAIVTRGRAGSDCRINLDKKGTKNMATEMETLLKVQQDSFGQALDKEVKLNTELQVKLDESASKVEELSADVKALTEKLDTMDAKATEIAHKIIKDFDVVLKVNADAKLIDDKGTIDMKAIKLAALETAGLKVAQDADDSVIDGMLKAAAELKPALESNAAHKLNTNQDSADAQLSNRDKWILEQSKRV